MHEFDILDCRSGPSRNGDAVSAGVARAVAQAITTAGGSSSKTVNLSVNLDGRQIIKSINGAQRRAGKVLLEV